MQKITHSSLLRSQITALTLTLTAGLGIMHDQIKFLVGYAGICYSELGLRRVRTRRRRGSHIHRSSYYLTTKLGCVDAWISRKQ